MSLEQFSLLVGIGLVIAQLVLILGGLLFVLLRDFRTWVQEKISVRTWFILACLTVIGAIIGSLIYSNIYELEICHYCWYQRMLIYPQGIVLGVALWKKEYTSAIWTSLILSFLALAISLYHYALNLNTIFHPESLLVPCDATGISCAAVPLRIFGYITIPFMTIVIASLLIMMMIFAKRIMKE